VKKPTWSAGQVVANSPLPVPVCVSGGTSRGTGGAVEAVDGGAKPDSATIVP